MSTITIELTDEAAATLKALAKKCGSSEDAVVAQAIGRLAGERRDGADTLLSKDEFDAFVCQLEEGEKDPQVLAARERLMTLKPVWQ